MLLQADIGTQQLDRMLCLCALALYEMSNGNGTQAWCDIGKFARTGLNHWGKRN
jgi:hypothetical protein